MQYNQDLWLYKVLGVKGGTKFGPKRRHLYSQSKGSENGTQEELKDYQTWWEGKSCDPSCKHDMVMTIMNSQLFCLLVLCLHIRSSDLSALEREAHHRCWNFLLKSWKMADSWRRENIVPSFVPCLSHQDIMTIYKLMATD